MTDTKLGMMMLMLAAMTIGCGGGDPEAESRVERYAPKDAIGAFHIDIAAVRQVVSDVIRKHPGEADKLNLGAIASVLEKIDAIVVYVVSGRRAQFSLFAVHGEIGPKELAFLLTRLTGELGSDAPEIEKHPHNGRNYVISTAIMIIDGREADDIEGNVLLAGFYAFLTDDLVATLGKGRPEALTWVFDKCDTSSTLWGGMVIDAARNPLGLKSMALSGNVKGDELVWGEMTFTGEQAAANVEKSVREGATQFFGPPMKITRSGATLTVESIQGGELVDMLHPSIRQGVELANQAACRENLKNIGEGFQRYLDEDQRERLPAKLQIMVDGKLLSPVVLRCPSDKSERACSYLYKDVRIAVSSSSTMILCDLKGNHKNVRCVGFLDGEAKTMSEAKFQAALKLDRNTAFAAALEKAGG